MSKMRLTKDEERLVTLFRKLCERDRFEVLVMIGDWLDMYKPIRKVQKKIPSVNPE